MLFKNVSNILKHLIINGNKWQFINLDGSESKPKYYLSDIQWAILVISLLLNFLLTGGYPSEFMGYVLSAFAISVSLFMSLLVSIFDKFENTDFSKKQKSEAEIIRLYLKKNFFKKFISITSLLIVLSIAIILMCGLSYFINLSHVVSPTSFSLNLREIDLFLTIKSIFIIAYRSILNFMLFNYLLLTVFIASSAYEYYISEISQKRIE